MPIRERAPVLAASQSSDNRAKRVFSRVTFHPRTRARAWYIMKAGGRTGEPDSEPDLARHVARRAAAHATRCPPVAALPHALCPSFVADQHSVLPTNFNVSTPPCRANCASPQISHTVPIVLPERAQRPPATQYRTVPAPFLHLASLRLPNAPLPPRPSAPPPLCACACESASLRLHCTCASTTATGATRTREGQSADASVSVSASVSAFVLDVAPPLRLRLELAGG